MASSAPSPSCFWCHSCHRIVRLPSPSTLLCPLCSEGFVEEVNGLSLHPSAALFLSNELSPQAPGRSDEALPQRRSPFSQAREILSLWRSQARQPGFSDAEEEGQHNSRFDAFDRMFSRREGRSEAIVTPGSNGFELWLGLGSRHGDPGPRMMDRLQGFFGRRRRSNIGNDRLGLGLGSRHNSGSRRLVDVRDFLLGPGGDLLIQQLIEGGNAGGHGSTPASKAAVDAMPTLTISKQSLEADDIYCAVCKEVFDIGGEAREMPCKHIYHSNCILPWLALHNSCPICRHEMPSEPLVDNQVSRTEESLETIRTEGNVGGNGERGLAIVGIPGIGILVRSFLLFGNGAHNEVTADNQTYVLTHASSNPLSNDNSREFETTHSDESVLSALRTDEIHPSVVGDDAASASQHSSNINPDMGDHNNTHSTASCSTTPHDTSNTGPGSATGRRSRNLLSWLSRQPSSSSQNRSSDTASEDSGSDSRRRRFWF